jgi:bifunctional non-homologous end joining protein LigD
MLATVADELPGQGWTFEQKYDGVRVLAFATPSRARLVTRNHNDKSRQFPEIAEALRAMSKKLRRPLVFDGEIVALTRNTPARFQTLQARMHVRGRDVIEEHRATTPVALVVFDLLVDGREVLIHEPWTVRRARLERVLTSSISPRVRLAESFPNAGKRLLGLARRRRWEGILAKRMDAPYTPGVRSDRWLKLKVEHRQEFVVGGYTEPRRTRPYFGALLLGYYENGKLMYAGHMGGGFTHRELADMHARLERLERKTSPFVPAPRTNEIAHWVRPSIVVEVKFNEWTEDGRLRQPILVGVRDDKLAKDVTREGESAYRRSRPRRTAANKKRPTTRRDR